VHLAALTQNPAFTSAHIFGNAVLVSKSVWRGYDRFRQSLSDDILARISKNLLRRWVKL